jgi:hypothetical protein
MEREPFSRAFALLSRELDHPQRDVETDHARAAPGERERKVSRAGGEIERTRAGPRRRQFDQPPLPPAILSVRERHRDEIVTIGDGCEQRAHVPPLAVWRRDAIV